MFMKAVPKSGGSGILVMILMIGVLWYSGAGGWMWQRVQRFGDDCYGMVAQLGVSAANPVCGGVTKAIAAMDSAGQRLSAQIHGWTSGAGVSVAAAGNSFSLQSIGDAVQQRLSGLGSSSQELSQMMGAGPQSLLRGNAAQQLRNAVDSFSIGQHYLQDGSATQALPWLRHGASLPSGYGLMSQLSLGDMYSRGAGGVTADPVKAQYYYQQAQQSLNSLSTSPTPQGQQLLKSLPASPQVISQQLNQAIEQLKGAH